MPTESTRSISTPNPRERSLIVVPEESAFATNPSILPKKYTKYKDCPRELFAMDYPPAKWGDYVYIEQVGENGLLFVKSKTPKERNTPINRKSISDPKSWAAVLEWMQFGKDSGFPLSQTTINQQNEQSIVTADRWLVPRGLRPGQEMMTNIDIVEYLSEVPWPDWATESDEPQPTEVMWDLNGSHGSTGRVLHDKVTVPAQSNAGYRVVSSSGNIQSGNATGSREWVFPKTNHKRRRDYEVVVVKYIDGQYLRSVYTFRVPANQSKVIKLN